jgi:hypothetical protein
MFFRLFPFPDFLGQALICLLEFGGLRLNFRLKIF